MGEQGDTEEARRTVVAGGAFTTQSTMQQAGSNATGAYKDRVQAQGQAQQTGDKSSNSLGGGHPYAVAEGDHAIGETGGREGNDV